MDYRRELSAPRKRRVLPLAALPIVMLLCVTTAFPQLAKRRAARGPAAESEEFAWERYLLANAPEPTFRFPVAHQHRGGGCYGYLYISRRDMRYEVVRPADDRDHGFLISRAALNEARQWRVMGSAMPEVEFKFNNGKTYHFFRVRDTLIGESEKYRFRWEDARSWEPLAQAAEHFDSVLALAQQRGGVQASASGPKVRVMEPAVTDPGVPVEVAEPLLTLRGAASDPRGVLSVTVNNQEAELRSAGDIRTVEFTARNVPLQEGLNRVNLVATNVDHRSSRYALSVWLKGAGAPAQPGTPASPVVGGNTPAPAVDTGERITVEVFSDPSGSDILLDGDFMGTTPSILKVRPGNHTVHLEHPGYKPWQQDLALPSNSPLKTIRATMDKIE